jgi:hypothetical protein
VWGQINPLLLVASVVTMAFSAIGTRVVFAIPLDLRANWIFLLTGVRRAPECLSGGRSAQLLLAAPVWALSGALCFWSSPWQAAPGHLAILALFGLVSAELCLCRFDKIPFTCSYLPGKSQLHLAVLAVGYMLWVIGLNSKEFQALEDPAGVASLLTVCDGNFNEWRTFLFCCNSNLMPRLPRQPLPQSIPAIQRHSRVC